MEDSEQRERILGIKATLFKALIFICIIVFLIPIILYLLIVELIFRIEFQIFSNITNKKVIVVSSDSPIWHDYVKEKLVPLFGDRELTLNWSQRKEWDKSKWEVKAFHHWGGQREFNPLVIINKGLFQIKVIRLHKAFIEYKHGNASYLHKREMEIFEAIKGLKN